MDDTAQISDTVYQVLARKYRPATFADLIGQEAMVRTLKNAFAADRIAQAFIMTGIRGTGKTTTARIIAKGLNCTGPDGTSGPTTDPCGVCDNCKGIMAGQHVDVIEMDGASQTKIDDIRSNILDSVYYAPAAARFKVYIIDEVHMLSNSAFNALLKTLEEPPSHVKFIFATTEIRKVPVTVLSRCQRFDLRRIEPEVMIAHLKRIAGLEKAEISDEALALITRAAEGSVRDAMSLMDQAISHGAGETTADQVRAMLGLADRGRVMDLFDKIMSGDAAGALDELGAQYSDGADPMAVLNDLAEITHWLSVIKITPDAANDPTISPDERTRGQVLSSKLAMRVLTRMWQMLLKALDEVSLAPNSMMAAEMAVIRLTHVSELPSPDDLIRKLQNTPMPSAPATPSPSPAPNDHGSGPRAQMRTSGFSSGGAATALSPAAETALSRFPTFDSVVAFIEANRDIKLLVEIKTSLRLVAYQPGRIEFQPTERAPADLAPRLAQQLKGWTGVRWGVTVVSEGGGQTIDEQDHAKRRAMEDEISEHPMMQAVIASFPNAKITQIRTLEEIVAQAASEALPEVPDEWDPFEEDD
ncbi:MAG: DNA polymerase-3 subunit gamma/tau [Paracoccaceae bacterium]|jgi:DNA polymerase-3 subunit gamma/tau